MGEALMTNEPFDIDKIADDAATNDGRVVVWAINENTRAMQALVSEVRALRESFGTCAHGYTICPFCIRDAMGEVR